MTICEVVLCAISCLLFSCILCWAIVLIGTVAWTVYVCATNKDDELNESDIQTMVIVEAYYRFFTYQK